MLNQLNRNVVRTWLRINRLPLSAVQTVTRRRSDEWAPALAYEDFEARVKQASGRALRDPELVDEGRVQAAKVRELREAARLEREAEERRTRAGAEVASKRESLAEREETTEERQARRDREREAALERERQQADERAAERSDAAAAAAEAREKQVRARERDARETALDEQSEALAEQRDALEAKADVAALDDDLEATKALRAAKKNARRRTA